jgi:Raf kinase inhibitor-like YbhB/YbcL family protein
MLEKIPADLGRALRGIRAGYDKIVSESADFADVPELIALESPAFEDGAPLPARYTADGEKLSPPLRWRGAIEDATGLALIVEDPDAPTPEPLVHLLVWSLPATMTELPQGFFKSPHHEGVDEMLGRNGVARPGWLPPDPPRGHGRHLYVFQLFALDRRLGFDKHPTRAEVVKAMKGHALAKGTLIGAYERP